MKATRSNQGHALRAGGQAIFRIGDFGRMDANGYFFITDRLKRMINASGFKICPTGQTQFLIILSIL